MDLLWMIEKKLLKIKIYGMKKKQFIWIEKENWTELYTYPDM